jgi:hypothetical protein
MQYIKNGEQEIPDFFKEVIKEKHARVGFQRDSISGGRFLTPNLLLAVKLIVCLKMLWVY